MFSSARKSRQRKGAGKRLGDDEMINEVNVKHEFDEMGDYCFESLKQVEQATSIDMRVTNNFADEKCKLCLESFTSETQLKHHITTMHNGISKIEDIPIKKEVDNGFEPNETEDEPRIKIEEGETDDYYYKSIFDIAENIDMQLKEHQKTINENAYNVGKTCINKKVKVEVKNSGLLDLQTTNYKNTFSENRTRNEVNKKTDGRYFESRIETENNTKTATNSTNEDITNRRFFQCNLCQKMYCTKKQITLHILKSHQISTDKHCPQKLNTIHCNEFTKTYVNISRPYKCDVCLKHFSKNFNLTQHKRMHTGEKPYKCNVCKSTFSQKVHLTRHERVHTGEKPYKCDVCQNSFSQKTNLTRHEHVHTGKKPYKCVVCKKNFSRKNVLARHERVHTGERPYKCNVCKNTFSRKAHLTRHERVHTVEKP
ncbi:zinc finger protein 845-like [Adelges cooleyi]|uniref:zinc finger protein 845-like n=1 Tax=Adelges cooleyi TaxID=133065 RepID=UPI0021806EE5|nr:zinc finger protein 845-like [Adelges cooleyi]